MMTQKEKDMLEKLKKKEKEEKKIKKKLEQEFWSQVHEKRFEILNKFVSEKEMLVYMSDIALTPIAREYNCTTQELYNHIMSQTQINYFKQTQNK